MHATRHEVTIITDADGNGTGYTPPVNGRVFSLQYVKTDYADGVDFTITGETTGQSLLAETNLNAAAIRATRQLTYTTGGASIGAGVYDFIVLADERVKIVVAQGGAVKTGKIIVTVG